MKQLTYKEAIDIFSKSPQLHIQVPLVHRDGKGHGWLPVDKVKYLDMLKDVTNAAEVIFPWGIEIENDGELFLHPKMQEGLLDNRTGSNQ